MRLLTSRWFLPTALLGMLALYALAHLLMSRTVLGLRADDTVDTLARELGIARHLDKLPETLSVGERQRVALVSGCGSSWGHASSSSLSSLSCF